MSQIKTLLLSLALIGLIVPTSVLQSCECCTEEKPSVCEKSCCSPAVSNKSCCSHVVAKSCCSDNDCCGKCHCSKLPNHAIPTEDSRNGTERHEQQVATTLIESGHCPSHATLAIGWDLGTSCSTSSQRLHSRLCVWLN